MLRKMMKPKKEGRHKGVAALFLGLGRSLGSGRSLIALKSHMTLDIKFKVSLCVVVGDILYDLTQDVVIFGEFAVIHPVSEQIAEDAPEVLVPCVGQEASGVGQHSYEAGQIAKVCKGD